MSHQQIGKTEAAAHAAIERDAKATYDAAYAESLRQYREDDDHGAFTARNLAVSAAYKAAIAPVWERRGAILEHIDD